MDRDAHDDADHDADGRSAGASDGADASEGAGHPHDGAGASGAHPRRRSAAAAGAGGTHDAETDPGAGELLLVGDEASTRLIAESLEADGHRCTSATDSDQARRCVVERRFDVIVLDLDILAGRAFDLVQLAARMSPATLCVVRSRSAKLEAVIAAMRAGIGDYFVGALQVPQLRRRIGAAIRRARESRGRLDRAARLASLCRALVAKRGGGAADLERIASLMDDVGDASALGDVGDENRISGLDDVDGTEAGADDSRRSPTGLPLDRVEPTNTAGARGRDARGPEPRRIPDRVSDFEEAASQHLDPEQLVTAAIEHFARALGAVNVAVFLGSGSCRFGLAAYARADLPRILVEPALIRWAGETCPIAAADGRVQVLPDATMLFTKAGPVNGASSAGLMGNSASGGGASTAPGSHLAAELSRRAAVIVPCRHEAVCDAIFIVLPQVGANVPASAAQDLAAFATSFARQLQRIQRVHSRYRPSWPREEE